ncbi:MAG: hypothetical protein LBF27_29740 [Sphingobacterium sp.]|nr:hypothetical protein [Sphingobacterium sp.]
MKYLIPALLLCGAFNYSCQKDGPEKDNSRLALFKKATQFNSNISETSFEFQYDTQGRLTKVNDQVYYYGQNGKVDYSRIEARNQNNGIIREKIIRLSYHWDQQNRLKNIIMDSLYHKSYSVSENILYEESLAKDVLLSSYFYTPGASAPTKIVYRKLDGSNGKIGLEEEAMYTLEADNITKSKRYEYLMTPLPSLLGDYKFGLTLFSFFQYSNTINPLYPIYKQMGFNPVDINQVISKNLENAFFSTSVQGKTDQEMQPDWAKKTAVKITLDASGKSTAMNYVVKADFGDAKDVILSEVLLNYVYE